MVVVLHKKRTMTPEAHKSLKCIKIPCKCFSPVLSAAAHLPPVAVATLTHGWDAVGTHRAEWTLFTVMQWRLWP